MDKPKNCVYCGHDGLLNTTFFTDGLGVECSNPDCHLWKQPTKFDEWQAMEKRTVEQIKADAEAAGRWPRLLQKPCKPEEFISAHDFASRHGVTDATANRWARTGKVVAQFHYSLGCRPLFFENGVETNIGIAIMQHSTGGWTIRNDQQRPTRQGA